MVFDFLSSALRRSEWGNSRRRSGEWLTGSSNPGLGANLAEETRTGVVASAGQEGSYRQTSASPMLHDKRRIRTHRQPRHHLWMDEQRDKTPSKDSSSSLSRPACTSAALKRFRRQKKWSLNQQQQREEEQRRVRDKFYGNVATAASMEDVNMGMASNPQVLHAAKSTPSLFVLPLVNEEHDEMAIENDMNSSSNHSSASGTMDSSCSNKVGLKFWKDSLDSLAETRSTLSSRSSEAARKEKSFDANENNNEDFEEHGMLMSDSGMGSNRATPLSTLSIGSNGSSSRAESIKSNNNNDDNNNNNNNENNDDDNDDDKNVDNDDDEEPELAVDDLVHRLSPLLEERTRTRLPQVFSKRIRCMEYLGDAIDLDSVKAALSSAKRKQQTCEEGQEEGTEEECSDDPLTMLKNSLKKAISRRLAHLETLEQRLHARVISNEQLGSSVISAFGCVAKSCESIKLELHVEEIDKITKLLLNLALRLAKSEEMGREQTEIESELATRQSKLMSQLSEAKGLKLNIERRASMLLGLIKSYLDADLVAKYEHFVETKVALIVAIRETEETIRRTKEQLHFITTIY